MKIEGGTVRLVALADGRGRIRGLHAVDVTFMGPGVVKATSGTVIEDCRWEDEGRGPEAIVWEIDENRPSILGAVVLDACELIRCHFVGVGYAAYPAEANAFFGRTIV